MAVRTIEDAYEEVKKQIGTRYTERDFIQRVVTNLLPSWRWFNTEVTRDGLRHFVNGAGDFNPLYRDDDYAKKTKYGGIIAPATYLYTAVIAEGAWLAHSGGLHPFGSGTEWEWFRPLWLDDEMHWKGIVPANAN